MTLSAVLWNPRATSIDVILSASEESHTTFAALQVPESSAGKAQNQDYYRLAGRFDCLTAVQ